MALILSIFGRIPWQAWLVAGVLVSAAVWHWSEVREAVRASYERLERQSEKQGSAADKAEIGVLQCQPGKWNREAGKCEQ